MTSFRKSYHRRLQQCSRGVHPPRFHECIEAMLDTIEHEVITRIATLETAKHSTDTKDAQE